MPAGVGSGEVSAILPGVGAGLAAGIAVAVVVAGEAELSSRATLKRYDLGTSANVTRMKVSLANREVIDVTGTRVEILDPLFVHWLRRG